MARKKIKKYQVFWAITGVIALIAFLIVVSKVWSVTHHPEEALREERRHRMSENSSAPSVGDAANDTAHNFNNIKEGKFLEKAKWPKVPERRRVLVPVNNGDEKAETRDAAKSYYNEN